jgi:4-amino-4-deoxy-L-arabinose transferase-like glycosyltransferase
MHAGETLVDHINSGGMRDAGVMSASMVTRDKDGGDSEPIWLIVVASVLGGLLVIGVIAAGVYFIMKKRGHSSVRIRALVLLLLLFVCGFACKTCL